MATTATPSAIRPKDFLALDSLLSDEERDIRDTVRAFVTDKVLPFIGEWFEEARIPTELAKELTSARDYTSDFTSHAPSATAFAAALLTAADWDAVYEEFVTYAAYALAMSVNPNNHALDGGRASSAMELEAVDALAKMFGFPQHLGHLLIAQAIEVHQRQRTVHLGQLANGPIISLLDAP